VLGVQAYLIVAVVLGASIGGCAYLNLERSDILTHLSIGTSDTNMFTTVMCRSVLCAPPNPAFRRDIGLHVYVAS